MADGWKVSTTSLWVGILSAAGAFATLIWVLVNVVLDKAGVDRWQTLGLVAVAVAIAFAVAAMIRFALSPLMGPAPSSASGDADASVRGRIAPMVLAVGTSAIVGLAVVMIMAFAILSAQTGFDTLKGRIDTLLTGVFSTVLPVLATWVGTVLAFYFGSENFRQAAQSTREVLGDRLGTTKKVGDLMKQYKDIARFEVDDVAAAENNLRVMDMIHTFSAAAPRVIVFKKDRTPIYVIRSTSPPMPEGWLTSDYAPGDYFKDADPAKAKEKENTPLKAYLDADHNRDDARKFGFIDANASVEDAIALMLKNGIDDLFITKDGVPANPVLGWTTQKDLAKK